MDLAGTLINTFVVVAVGGFLTYVTLDRYRRLRQELKAEIKGLDGRITGLDGRITGVRLELKGDMEGLKGDIARLESRMDAGFTAVRSDLTAVALAVGARPSGVPGET